jgi:uncharacterized protein
MNHPKQAAADEPPIASEPRAARTSLRDVPWGWADIWIGLISLVAMLAYVGMMSPAALHRSWLPLTLLVMAWTTAYPLLVARQRVGFPSWPRPRSLIVEGLIAIVLAAVLLAAMAAFTKLLARSVGGANVPETPLEPIANSSDRDGLAVLAFLAVLIGPVAEEVYFRGMIYNALRQRVHPVIAAILQALAFGLFHPFHIVYRAAIAVVGFLLAMIYEWRKTLLTPILVHALVNAASFAMVFLATAAYDGAPVLGVVGEKDEGGCRVTQVWPGGAADEAGLRVGDVITGAGENAVADLRDVKLILLSHKPGDRIRVWFRRGRSDLIVEATLKARPK